MWIHGDKEGVGYQAEGTPGAISTTGSVLHRQRATEQGLDDGQRAQNPEISPPAWCWWKFTEG